MVQLVRGKIAIPGNNSVDVSELRLSALQRQLRTRLRPVLRAADFDAFNLDRAIATVVEMAKVIEEE